MIYLRVRKKINVIIFGLCSTKFDRNENNRWQYFLTLLESNGFELVEHSHPDLEYYLEVDFDVDSIKKIVNKLPRENRILIRVEPPSINPTQFKSNIDNLFGAVIQVITLPSTTNKEIPWIPGFFPQRDHFLDLRNKNFMDYESLFISVNEKKNLAYTLKDSYFHFGIVNSNNINLFSTNLYSTRRKILNKISRSGFEIVVAGHGWDSSLIIWAKKHFIEIFRAFKTKTLVSPSKFYINIRKSNNIKIIGQVKNEIEIYSKVKYSIIIESDIYDFSEKLFNCLLSGSVPLYIGPELSTVGLSRDLVLEFPTKMCDVTRFLENLSDKDLYEKKRKYIENWLNIETNFHYWSTESGFQRLFSIFNSRF